jgi:hypothetical protein
MENRNENSDPMDAAVIAATRHWLEAAVIGLNLCPFAHAPHTGNRIGYAVSHATTAPGLVDDLIVALQGLAQSEEFETSLLIHPFVLGDFAEYNDFLDVADEVLVRMELEGVIQIASFHPGYQFSGTEADDMGNFTNRSPYPMLHLLRESSLDRVLETYPDTDRIYKRNIEVLRELGREGWQRLAVGPAVSDDADR